jgi:hypothetical protein
MFCKYSAVLCLDVDAFFLFVCSVCMLCKQKEVVVSQEAEPVEESQQHDIVSPPPSPPRTPPRCAGVTRRRSCPRLPPLQSTACMRLPSRHRCAAVAALTRLPAPGTLQRHRQRSPMPRAHAREPTSTSSRSMRRRGLGGCCGGRLYLHCVGSCDTAEAISFHPATEFQQAIQVAIEFQLVTPSLPPPCFHRKNCDWPAQPVTLAGQTRHKLNLLPLLVQLTGLPGLPVLPKAAQSNSIQSNPSPCL